MQSKSCASAVLVCPYQAKPDGGKTCERELLENVLSLGAQESLPSRPCLQPLSNACLNILYKAERCKQERLKKADAEHHQAFTSSQAERGSEQHLSLCSLQDLSTFTLSCSLCQCMKDRSRGETSGTAVGLTPL